MRDINRRPDGDGGEPKPLPRGILVALIGPDGVGKSSQTVRLTALFQRKYKCTAVYLGSGEGGWKLRRLAKRNLRKLRSSGRRSGAGARSAARGNRFGTNHSIWTGVSGLVAAFERYVSLRRAVRLARSGSLVICDRWPQSLRAGLFDGPLLLDPKASWAVRLTSKIEGNIYRRMETYRPDLAIHLVTDFGTSNARKPGDRTRADFDQRLELMRQMRIFNPAVVTVDASQSFDAVTEDLRRHINQAIMAAS